MEPGDWQTRMGARRKKAGAGNQKRVDNVYSRRCLSESGHCYSLPPPQTSPPYQEWEQQGVNPSLGKKIHFPSLYNILRELVLE